MEKIKGTMEEQLKLEQESKELAEKLFRATYEQASKDGRGGETTIGGHLIENTWDTVLINIKAVLYPKTKRGVVPSYQGVINTLQGLVDAKDLVQIVSQSTMNVLLNGVLQGEDTSVYFDKAVDEIVMAVTNEVAAYEYTRETTRQNAAFYEDGLKKRQGIQYKRAYASKAYKIMGFTPTNLDETELYKLCTKFVEAAIMGSGYFVQDTTTTIYKGKPKEKKILKAHPWLLEAWSKSIDMLALNAYKMNPMCISPKPWTSCFDGAYYGASATYAQFIRVNFHQKNSFIMDYMMKLEQLDLSYVFNAVNHLQETPFTINQKVLDTMVAIMESNGGLGGLPNTNETPKPPRLDNPTEDELKKYKKVLTSFYKHERARISKVLRTNSTLGTAKKYSKYEEIFFPWNIDYRGRIYPMCPSLNPQGDDTQKALLSFARPTPIKDEADLKWLYIAGAGFAGLDKIPFAERIKWVEDNKNNILESASDPLTNTWWDDIAHDESPFEFLAFCFTMQELEEYKKVNNGSAIGWVCGLPISFDGTCSGLQHFSMLLADEVGGYNVNLVPSEEVHDIYQVVADKVNVVLKDDVMNGTDDGYKTNKKGEKVLDSNGNPCIKYGTRELAMEWLSYGLAKFGSDGIKRKVCKRSVMTLAYGSRSYGFAENLKTDIITPWMDEHEDNKIFLSKSQAANYMAGLIWDAVTTTVVKAVEGMEWLKQIANIIGKNGETVSWMSPNGLPIQQNKFVQKVKAHRLRFNGSYIRVYVPEKATEIDARGQAQAIAPNFIHSMDACHMQRVITAQSSKENINFFMIHDSFGTDLAHAESMFHDIREELVSMYKGHNYLQEFLDDVSYLLPEDAEVPPIPKKGTMNLDAVKVSKYCFA